MSNVLPSRRYRHYAREINFSNCIMGLIMKNRNQYYKLIPAAVLFVALPLLLWLLGGFPRKSILKEALSLLTIFAFCFMLAEFYFTRHNKHFKKGVEFRMVVKLHRNLGYIFVLVLLLHPFFIILPRFFEAGVAPGDAFVAMITEFGSLGVVLGLIAYAIMFLIFITSYFRNKFDLSYKTGRVLHGCLSILFISAAAWHVIDIGRHSNTAFTVYIILMVLGGVFFLLRTYFLDVKKSES